jgi:F1F0 ATPase subunit 2
MAPVSAVLYLAAGAVLGVLYFGLLAWTVRLHASQAAASRIMPLYVVRIALAVAAFWAIAQYGAAALLLALLGFVLARYPVQRWQGGG